ncbi:GNAT family N-acetyltransferase [Rugosimonospora africana]|uniref:GNAT family N-acetyltransferase n=1 Tax=Rugosimonospora africana TaxID=556532 RepID=UPI003570FEF9
MNITVRDNPEQHRYEAVADDAVAGIIQYRDRHDGARVFLHTETMPDFAGKGVASVLVRQALEMERERRQMVVPVCPFVSAFLERHPEYKDVTERPTR